MATDAATRLDSREWVERARSLAPVVAQYRDEMETQRHMPLPLADAMRERNLFSLWFPRALGGPELSVETEVLVMEELGRLDGSVGWNSMISTNHSILWAHLAHDVAAECTKGGRTVIAGTIGGGGSREAPGGGVAVSVAGGYRITGKWAFASGCHHADWMVGNGRISENGELRRTPQGNVGLFSFLLQPSEATLLDTWHTTGMRGTGSHHFEAADVFVPEERVFSTARPASYQPSVIYSTSRAVPWSASIAGVSLGIARDAVDSFIEIAKSKTPGALSTSLMERDSVHRAVGEAEGRLRSARLFLLDTANQVDACIEHGEDIPDDLGALMRCAASTASLSATAVVDAMYTAAGSGGIYITSRLDRCFRDIHTLITHTVGGIAGLPVAGRYYLGLGLANPL